MEAVAALGIAAAAGQFAEQAIAIAKVLLSAISVIKDTPEKAQGHWEMIDHLLAIYQLIIDEKH